MAKTFRVVQDIPVAFRSGLKEDIPVGTVVYEYSGSTFEVIAPHEIPITIEPDEPPFFGIPSEYLEKVL